MIQTIYLATFRINIRNTKTQRPPSSSIPKWNPPIPQNRSINVNLAEELPSKPCATGRRRIGVRTACVSLFDTFGLIVTLDLLLHIGLYE